MHKKGTDGQPVRSFFRVTVELEAEAVLGALTDATEGGPGAGATADGTGVIEALLHDDASKGRSGKAEDGDGDESKLLHGDSC